MFEHLLQSGKVGNMKVKNRKHGENINLQYKDKSIQMAIVLIGRVETIERYGFEPYIRHINSLLNNGITTVYILAKGIPSIHFAEYITNRVRKSVTLKKIDEFPSPGSEYGSKKKYFKCFCLEK